MAEEPSILDPGAGTETSQAQVSGTSELRQELDSDVIVRYIRRMTVAMLQEGEEGEQESSALELCLTSKEAREAIKKYIRDAQERTLQVPIYCLALNIHLLLLLFILDKQSYCDNSRGRVG